MLHRDSITHINPSHFPFYSPTLSASNTTRKQLNEWKEKASTSWFNPKRTKDQPALPRGHDLTPLCRQLSSNRICQRERKTLYEQKPKIEENTRSVNPHSLHRKRANRERERTLKCEKSSPWIIVGILSIRWFSGCLNKIVFFSSTTTALRAVFPTNKALD